MTFFKRLGILLLLVFLGRGLLFRATVKYHAIGQRKNVALTDSIFLAEIKKIHPKNTTEQYIKQSLRLTNKTLSFFTAKCSRSPDELVRTGRANCVGYAALFSAIMDQFLLQDSIQNYEVTHLVGKLSVVGYDLHQITNSPFFKDHDYVEIKDLSTNKKWLVDPSLYDYTGIRYVLAGNHLTILR